MGAIHRTLPATNKIVGGGGRRNCGNSDNKSGLGWKKPTPIAAHCRCTASQSPSSSFRFPTSGITSNHPSERLWPTTLLPLTVPFHCFSCPVSKSSRSPPTSQPRTVFPGTLTRPFLEIDIGIPSPSCDHSSVIRAHQHKREAVKEHVASGKRHARKAARKAAAAAAQSRSHAFVHHASQPHLLFRRP